MTTGCLLEMLVGKKSLSEFTHIILDEVHERDEDTDILLLLVRELWKSRISTKVILMSATVDASRFSDYLKAPVINVESAPPFAVKEFYLDDLRSMPVR
jgi:HrpA-like RNA helicase